MRGFVAAGLAGVALFLGSAAHAQFTGVLRSPPPPPRQDWRTIDSRSTRIDTARERGDIRDRIDDGRASGQLSRREARRLRRENGQLGVLADRYAQDGLSDAEARELDTRAAVLRDQVNVQRLSGAGGARRR